MEATIETSHPKPFERDGSHRRVTALHKEAPVQRIAAAGPIMLVTHPKMLDERNNREKWTAASSTARLNWLVTQSHPLRGASAREAHCLPRSRRPPAKSTS